ncbi:MAG: helix-turn-helix transcriptional regulator [Nitrososphaera sp.]
MEREDGEHLASDLFMELASETRCALLASLGRRPARLSTLARELGITIQDVHRNVNRLAEAGLVKRENNEFCITQFGSAVAGQIPYFAFLAARREFFKEHAFGGIPAKFIQRIGALERCELVSSVTPVMEALKKLEMSAKSRLKIIAAQAWAEEGNILVDRARSGVDVQVVVGRNTIFPKDVAESGRNTMRELDGRMKSRMADSVGFGLYIADGQSAVMLPNLKGEVVMDALLAGSDPVFCEWCADLFDHVWERAGPFDMTKVTVV